MAKIFHTEMRRLLFFIFSFLLVSSALAQEIVLPKNDNYYRKNPVWIQLMVDENVNFFEIEKAFELYWENREKPLEEHDVIGEAKENDKMEKRYIKRLFKKTTLTDKELAFEVKRYNQWKMLVLPYVQNDGSILTKDQQLEIWRKEQLRPKL